MGRREHTQGRKRGGRASAESEGMRHGRRGSRFQQLSTGLHASLYLAALVTTLVKMGKVHGSLARAGKVKSQCPKVEKQEKPKQPKGRAKKRLLYNR